MNANRWEDVFGGCIHRADCIISANADLLDDGVDRYQSRGSLRGRRSAESQHLGADRRPRRAATVTGSGSESALMLRMIAPLRFTVISRSEAVSGLIERHHARDLGVGALIVGLLAHPRRGVEYGERPPEQTIHRRRRSMRAGACSSPRAISGARVGRCRRSPFDRGIDRFPLSYELDATGAASRLAAPRGIQNEKVAPGPPSFASAHSRPWCLSMMERLTESPMPIPSVFVV